MRLAGGDELLLFAGSGQSLKPAEVGPSVRSSVGICARARVLCVFVFRLPSWVRAGVCACMLARVCVRACVHVRACLCSGYARDSVPELSWMLA